MDKITYFNCYLNPNHMEGPSIKIKKKKNYIYIHDVGIRLIYYFLM